MSARDSARVAGAMVLAILATTPMWVSAILLDRPLASTSVVELLFLAAIWPLGEEILFRGFTFGQLHRHAGRSRHPGRQCHRR